MPMPDLEIDLQASARTTIQTSLDIDAESYTAREEWIKKRLAEYRTIDAYIRTAKRLADGIGLVHEPNITMRPEARDYMPILNDVARRLQEGDSAVIALAAHIGYMPTDRERVMIDATRKYVDHKDFVVYDATSNRFRFVWASSHRVVRSLQKAEEIEDTAERQAVDDAIKLLSERVGEEDVPLTPTERLAMLRLAERDAAQQIYELLTERKRIISETLADMDNFFHEWYLILWHKYVMDEHWRHVCELAGRDGTPLTTDEYRWSRKKAIREFDKLSGGLR